MNKLSKKYHIFELNVANINIVCGILFIVTIALSAVLYKGNLIQEFSEVNLMLLLLANILTMLLHEILHSVSYVIYGADFKKIVYGSYIEKGVLYCLCKQNISRKNILNSLMFPLFYLGIIPFIIAIIFRIPFLLFLAILNIAGAAGDIIMFMYIIRLDKKIEFTEFDNPMRFAIYTDKDIKVKTFGLDYIETCNNISRKDYKKITISKASYIVLAVLIILTIVSVVL